MNVLLVITNINGFHEVPYSFGLTSIASHTQSKGHNVKITAIREHKDFSTFIEIVKSFNPRVVGFTSVSSQYQFVKKAAQLVKELNKDITIVAGGVHPTLYPSALVESNSIDAFFVGESEFAFSDFLDKLEKKEDFTNVNNLAYKKDGKVIVNPLNPFISSLDAIPHPMRDDIFIEYIQKNGYAPFFFSRGCPFRCTYCSNHALAKVYGLTVNKTRFKPVDACIDEIKKAEEIYPFNKVYIYDDTFGLDRKWMVEFCDKYKKEIGKKFICLLRVNVVDEDFIRRLKEAGCKRIQFGVESGNEYIRNTVMNRGISEEQLFSAFNLCKKYGIETNAFNIIGVPGETEEMLWDTIRINRKIKPSDSGINIFYPYRGTVLGDYCFDNGLVDEEMYNSFSNERRDTVLKFPQEWREKLKYYHKNWDVLVDPYNPRKRISVALREHKTIFPILKKLKKSVLSFFSND